MKETIVTLFRNLFDSKGTSYHLKLEDALNRIKNGKSKDLITKIRKEKDKDERNKLKSQSVSILFNGKFKTRSADGLIQHSGLCVLDFDGFEDKNELKEFRKQLEEDKYSLAVFTSPSGNGLKSIVKIPPCEAGEHKLYFNKLEEHYHTRYFDRSGKDVSRVCYESYDPNIYINWKSELFEDKEEAEGYSYVERSPTIPISSDDEIMNRLLRWWEKKFTYTEGDRNNVLFKLAIACNDYGVQKHNTLNCLLSNFDLKESEITTIVRSAYSNVANFGTKYFEDNVRLASIKSGLKNGASEASLAKDIEPIVGAERAEEVVRDINRNLNNYWQIVNNRVVVNHVDFKRFLESNGFGKYYPEQAEHPVLVRVQSNIVNNSSIEKIKDFVLDDLAAKQLWEVWNHMAGSSKYFQDKYMNMLDSVSLCMLEDNKDAAYIYFENKVIQITRDQILELDYPDVDGFIWSNQIIPREFKASKKVDNDFQDLVGKVSDQDKDRTDALEHTLGYLMHGFKDKTDQKAIIFNDQEINDDPNGGSGKSIMLTALGYFKKMVKIDGKAFDPNKGDFVYQRVNLDTQVLAFDDVKKNFNFENLFSLITEGITVNRKNKDEIFIPFERSPKIIITTNYVINGAGNSHDRRRHEIEFFQYFNNKRTPIDEYGKLLFDEWGGKEWMRFDNYMVGLVQKYLNNGLTATVSINAELKRFIQSTTKEFYDFIEDGNLNTNTKIFNTDFQRAFGEEYKDFKMINIRTLKKWAKLWAEHNGWGFKEGRESQGRYFIIVNEETKTNHFQNVMDKDDEQFEIGELDF